MNRLMTLAEENGFSHFGKANMSAFTPLNEVREMCSSDRCGKYGENWACPPGCGTIGHARELISRYGSGIIVQTTGLLADEFDYEGMQSISQRHKKSFESFARQAKILFPDCLALTAGPCTICAKCTYPSRPCRFPSKRLSSMEAFGLWVSDICLKSGLEYNYGALTMTYTSCVLYNEER